VGRKPKEIPKRISGTGYTYAESRQLKYCKQAPNGTYEIDVNKIAEAVNAYITSNTDDNGTPIQPMSEAGLMEALGVHKRETYLSWLAGYVNPLHKADEAYTYNEALSEALARGQVKIARYCLENNTDKYSARIRERQAETMGYIGPAQSKVDIGGPISLGKWGKMAH
jgi:hypothetical protein